MSKNSMFEIHNNDKKRLINENLSSMININTQQPNTINKNNNIYNNIYNENITSNINQNDCVPGIVRQSNNSLFYDSNKNYVPVNLQQMEHVQPDNKPCHLTHILYTLDNRCDVNGCNYANEKQCYYEDKNATIRGSPHTQTQMMLSNQQNKENYNNKLVMEDKRSIELHDNTNLPLRNNTFPAEMPTYLKQHDSQTNTQSHAFCYPATTQSSLLVSNVKPRLACNDSPKYLIIVDRTKPDAIYKLMMTEPILAHNNPNTTNAKCLIPTSHIIANQVDGQTQHIVDINTINNGSRTNTNTCFTANDNVILIPTSMTDKECTLPYQSILHGSAYYLTNTTVNKQQEYRLPLFTQTNQHPTQLPSSSCCCVNNNSSYVNQLPTRVNICAPQNVLKFASSTDLKNGVVENDNNIYISNNNINSTCYGNNTLYHDANVSTNFAHQSTKAKEVHTTRSSRVRKEGVSYKENPIAINTSLNQLIVNFLPQQLSEEEFRTLFRPYGELIEERCHIIYDPYHTRQNFPISTHVNGSNDAIYISTSSETTLPSVICKCYDNRRHAYFTNVPSRRLKRSKGYGFIYYVNGVSTEEAIKELNGKEVYGRRIKVDYAHQQRATDANEMKTRVNESFKDDKEQITLFAQSEHKHPVPEITTKLSAPLTMASAELETLEMITTTMQNEESVSATCDTISNRQFSDAWSGNWETYIDAGSNVLNDNDVDDNDDDAEEDA